MSKKFFFFLFTITLFIASFLAISYPVIALTQYSENIQFGGYTNGYEGSHNVLTAIANPQLVLLSKYNLRFYNWQFDRVGGTTTYDFYYLNNASSWIQYPESTVYLNGNIKKDTQTGELAGYWFAAIYRQGTAWYSATIWVMDTDYHSHLDLEAYRKYCFVYANGNNMSFAEHVVVTKYAGNTDILTKTDIGFMVAPIGNKTIACPDGGGGTCQAYTYASSNIVSANIGYTGNISSFETFNTTFVKNSAFQSYFNITNLDNGNLEKSVWDTGAQTQAYANLTLKNRRIDIGYYEVGSLRTTRSYYSYIYSPITSTSIYGFTIDAMTNSIIANINVSFYNTTSGAYLGSTLSTASGYNFNISTHRYITIITSSTDYVAANVQLNLTQTNLPYRYDIALLTIEFLGSNNNSLLIKTYDANNFSIVPNVDISLAGLASSDISDMCTQGVAYQQLSFLNCYVGYLEVLNPTPSLFKSCICSYSGLETKYYGQTNSYGALWFGNLTPLNYTIYASKAGYVNASTHIVITNNSNYNTSIYLVSEYVYYGTPTPTPSSDALANQQLDTAIGFMSMIFSLTGLWTIITVGAAVGVAYETKSAIVTLAVIGLMIILGFAIGAIPLYIFILAALIIILSFASLSAKRLTGKEE